MSTPFLLGQMLEGHRKRFTSLILMEECIRKPCYVKLDKISSKYLATYPYLKLTFITPIVIRFSKQTRKERRANAMQHISQTITKSKSPTPNKNRNRGVRRVSLSEYTNKRYGVDYEMTQSSIAQTQSCKHQHDTSKLCSLSRCDVEQESKDNITSKNKIVLRKWREKWYVKMRSSYYSNEPSTQLLSNNDKTKRFVMSSSQRHSTDSRNESDDDCCSVSSITDQEMNDGLPDI